MPWKGRRKEGEVREEGIEKWRRKKGDEGGKVGKVRKEGRKIKWRMKRSEEEGMGGRKR
jgi:hypothetical protein